MTSFVLNTLSTQARSLLTGETGLINSGGLLLSASSNVAVTMTGAARLVNTGSVLAVNADTIQVSGLGASIVNQGRILAGSSDGPSSVNAIEYLGRTAEAQLQITNTGLIETRARLGSAIELITGGVTITNSGTIQSVDGFAIALRDSFGGTQGMTLVNSGTIASENAVAISVDNNDRDVVQNSGQILGRVFTTGGNDVVDNEGLISGSVNVGSGDDVVVNRGVIGDPLASSNVIEVSLGSGNDTIDGMESLVELTVVGGTGDDVYFVGSKGMIVIEAGGQGNDKVISAIDFDLAGTSVERLTLTGPALRGSGNEADNVITGSFLDNTLDGRDGNDVLFGGSGNDTTDGGTGDDTLFGESGNDRLNGNDGDDQMLSGSGNDFLVGGAGNDLMDGDVGDDFLFGEAGDDRNRGGEGNDVIRSGFGFDTIDGGAGNDIIDGGPDTDVLTGGAGADRFDFQSLSDSGTLPGARDFIVDFQPGVDKLFFRGLGLTLATEADGSVADAFTGRAGEVILVPVGTTGFVMVDANGDRLTDFVIEMPNASVLSASDFIL